jgi:hypothetical protein
VVEDARRCEAEAWRWGRFDHLPIVVVVSSLPSSPHQLTRTRCLFEQHEHEAMISQSSFESPTLLTGLALTVAQPIEPSH